MPIHITWKSHESLPDQSVLYWKFEDYWTWDDFRTAVNRAYYLSQTVSHSVNQIIDFTDAPHCPTRDVLFHLNRGIQRAPDNQGLMIVVNPPSILRAMEGLLRRLNPDKSDRYVVVDNMNMALSLLDLITAV